MNVPGNKRLTGRIAAEHIKLMAVPRLPAGVVELLAALGDASGIISAVMGPRWCAWATPRQVNYSDERSGLKFTGRLQDETI